MPIFPPSFGFEREKATPVVPDRVAHSLLLYSLNFFLIASIRLMTPL